MSTAVVALPGQTPRLHLRPLRHGGVLAGLWRGALLGLRRPIREIAATAELRRSGAPVPVPVVSLVSTTLKVPIDTP